MRHLFVNTLLGPLYFLFGAMNESVVGYILSLLMLPFIAMLGYLAGFYGISIIGKVFWKKEAEQERTFTKSPWNPTNNAKKGSVKKKKKNV
jgi:H+/Cl- antiporter ClcA